MDQYGYLIRVISILTAFAMAQVMSSWGEIIRHRDRVKVWWPVVIWLLLIFIFLIQTWWVMWQYRTIPAWNILSFGVLLGQLLAVILAMFIMTPDINGEGESTFDLKEHYWRNHRWFFFLGAVSVGLIFVFDLAVFKRSLFSAYDLIRLPGFVLLLVLAMSKSEKLHLIILAVASVLLIVFFVVSGLFYL